MPFYENYGEDFAVSCGKISKISQLAAMHIHPHYEVLLIPGKVKQISNINGRELVTVYEPSVTVFSPFSMHCTHLESENDGERIVFYFGERMIKDFPYAFKAFAAYEKAIYTRFIVSEELIEQIEPYLKLFRNGAYDLTLMKLNFLSLFHLILTNARIEGMQREAQDFSEIIKIIRYMSSHLNEKLTADDICKIFAISRSKLNKDFKKYISVSYHQLLIEMKLSKACFLLLNTKRGVNDVASELGFENENYFFHFFKKETGITPLEFRKKQKPLYMK